MFLLCAEGDVLFDFHFSTLSPCFNCYILAKVLAWQNWWKKPMSTKKRLQKNDLCFCEILTLPDNQLLCGMVDFPIQLCQGVSPVCHIFLSKLFPPSLVRLIVLFNVELKKSTKKQQRRPKSLKQEICLFSFGNFIWRIFINLFTISSRKPSHFLSSPLSSTNLSLTKNEKLRNWSVP